MMTSMIIQETDSKSNEIDKIDEICAGRIEEDGDVQMDDHRMEWNGMDMHRCMT